MSDSNRTITASTKVSSEMDEYLDDQAERLGMNRSELLRRLAYHYREATETGLSCPHCKNAVRIDL